MKRAVLLAALFGVGCGLGNPTSGEKLGTVIRLAQSGMLCTTWEATIVRGGFSSGSGALAAPFDFTIEDQRIVEQIQSALDHQREIKLTYQSEGIYSLCRSDSGGHFGRALALIGRAE